MTDAIVVLSEVMTTTSDMETNMTNLLYYKVAFEDKGEKRVYCN